MEAEDQIEILTTVGDYWHDQFVYHERMARLAMANAERFAAKVEQLRNSLGTAAVELAQKPDPFIERRLTLIQGGLSDGRQ